MMTVNEKRSTAILSGLMAVRMLGLFMVLPLLSTFAANLTHASPFLIGMAVGIYGLFQAIFQLILGPLSDRIGRKPIIAIGLFLLAVGSIIGAFCTSIFTLIFARAVQGASAIGSTIIAWLADLTSIENRAKAMAIVGAVIGSSFALALVFGALLNSSFGARSVFWCTALLALIGLMLVYFALPKKNLPNHSLTLTFKQGFTQTFFNPFLFRAYLSSFVLHTILAASFVVLPFILNAQVNLPPQQQWYFYLSIILICFMLIFPLLNRAERTKQQGLYFNASVFLIMLSQLCLGILPITLFSLFLFTLILFIGFTFLEAQLPALISRISSSHLKGTTLSLYSFMQFLGIFFGGSLGGFASKNHHYSEPFWITALLSFCWLFAIWPFSQQLDQKLKQATN